MSQLFLPLRSNAAWFTSAETRFVLEQRMKQYALLYDQVVLQNGRYRFVAVDNGGFENYTPPGVDDDSRLSIDYYTPGREFSLRVSADPGGEWHPLLGGETRAFYAADFLPILYDAGLLSVDYFAWLNGDIDPSAKTEAKAAARQDRRDPGLLAVLPDVHFLQGSIVDGLYIDATMAQALKLPFGADPHTSAAIDWKRRQVQSAFEPDVRSAVFDHWIAMGFPDYTGATWEELHDVRESAAGKDFRRMVERLTNAISAAAPVINDGRDLAEVITREFSQELVRELLARRASYTRATVNLAANIIPFGTVPATINDYWAAVKEERSWVCLLSAADGGEYRAEARRWF